MTEQRSGLLLETADLRNKTAELQRAGEALATGLEAGQRKAELGIAGAISG